MHYFVAAELYRAALDRIISLGNDDEDGDMIGPILDTARAALAGKTWEQAQEDARIDRWTGTDLGGRPA